MENKLLEKANEKEFAIAKKPYTKDEVELCIEYIYGKISTRQYAHAIGFKYSGNITHRVSGLLVWANNNGYIKIELTK